MDNEARRAKWSNFSNWVALLLVGGTLIFFLLTLFDWVTLDLIPAIVLELIALVAIEWLS